MELSQEEINLLKELALEKGKEILPLLLKKPNDWTLCYAAMIGNYEVVSRLLNEGYNPKAWDSYSLRLAAKQGHDKIVCLLLEHGTSHPRALKLAAKYGHLETVKVFFISGLPSDERTNSAMMVAAKHGYFDIVKFLAEHSGKCSIAIPARHGHFEIVKFLFNKENNKDNEKGLFHAAVSGHHEIVKFFLENNVPVFIEILNEIVRHGFIEEVKFLLTKVEPNEETLNIAIQEGQEKHTEIFKILLEDGRIDICRYGYDDLSLAVKQGNIEIVKLLLPKIQVPRCDSSFEVDGVLDIAAWRRDEEMVELLLPYFDKDAYIHALAIASKRGYIEIVKLIVDAL